MVLCKFIYMLSSWTLYDYPPTIRWRDRISDSGTEIDVRALQTLDSSFTDKMLITQAVGLHSHVSIGKCVMGFTTAEKINVKH